MILKKLIVTILLGCIAIFAREVSTAQAQSCWGTFSCCLVWEDTPTGCVSTGCNDGRTLKCSEDGTSCSVAGAPCGAEPYLNGTCQWTSCVKCTSTCTHRWEDTCDADCGMSFPMTCRGDFSGACNLTNNTCNNNGICGAGESCSNCPGDCNTYSAWSECSAACGGGTQTRTASCGGTVQTRACNTQACPVGDPPTCGWGSWSGCSESCGGGIQTRSNSCNGATETQACNTQSCTGGCTASCSGPFCGQSDGCGGTCSNADGATPGNITATPTNGGTVTTDSNGQVTINWTSSALAEMYQLELYPEGTNCLHAAAVCENVYGTSRLFTPDTNYTSYTYRVRPINNTCGSQVFGNWTPLATFTIMSQITGGFYLDSNALSTFDGTTCLPSGGPAITPGASAAIGAETRSGSVNGIISGTSYGILAPFWPVAGAPNNIVSLVPGEAGAGDVYECTCPTGCTYSGIASPQSGVNFFLRPASLSNNGWWQVFGGSSFAAAESGSAIVSKVPPTCESDGSCTPHILRKDIADTSDSAGFALTGGGEVDSAEDAGYQTSNVTDRIEQVVAKGTHANKFRETYDYFYRQYSLGTNPAEFDDFSATAGDARKPALAPLGGKTAYFHEGPLTIQNPWHLQATDDITEIVIFVDGDLTITDLNNVEQLIQVDEGAFLAFIVSGDIIIDSNVGNDTLTSNTPNIEGVFIADGIFRVESKGLAGGGDETFVGAGTFAGWSGVELLRDYASDAEPSRINENNNKAVERFIFRPDFVRVVPERLAAPRYVWQESN
jgi:hypothetical protein